jgi:hypothetical protein
VANTESGVKRGVTRRRLIQGGVLIGGAAWVAPAIESFASPAGAVAAASQPLPYGVVTCTKTLKDGTASVSFTCRHGAAAGSGDLSVTFKDTATPITRSGAGVSVRQNPTSPNDAIVEITAADNVTSFVLSGVAPSCGDTSNGSITVQVSDLSGYSKTLTFPAGSIAFTSAC